MQAHSRGGSLHKTLLPSFYNLCQLFVNPNYCSDSEDPWFRNKEHRRKGLPPLRCWWYEWYFNLRTAVVEAHAPSHLPIFKKRSYQRWWSQRPYTFVFKAFWTFFPFLKNKLNSASQNICFSSYQFLWEYNIECKLFLSLLCPSVAPVCSQHLSTWAVVVTITHNP